jgi:hypothetical protein
MTDLYDEFQQSLRGAPAETEAPDAPVLRELRLYWPWPVHAALENAIGSLGKSLHMSGSDKALKAAYDRVSARRRDQVRWRLSVLNECWSGIGAWLI